MQEKLKQLELLVSQAATRLQTLQSEAVSLRQKLRSQEATIARLKESETELKSLREWKRNTVSALKKLETRIDKEISRAQEEDVIDTLRQALMVALHFAAKSYLKDLKDGGKLKEEAGRLDQLISKLQNTLQADK